MRFDLSTLYFLAIGTLLLSAGMTLWERQPLRARELRVLAAGYATLAGGCLLATLRSHFPAGSGAAISNLVVMMGYLLILHGVAALNHRHHRAGSLTLLALVALSWAIAGSEWEESFWIYASSLPISLVCGVTAWEMAQNANLRRLRSSRVVIALTALHAFVYAARLLILPALADTFGSGLLTMAATATMYEGVLYSVGLPMALLALVREEAHEQLLDASRSDYLTGLGNRRWFFEEGERLVRCRADVPSVSLLAFDLDHFKAINDRHGHAGGDAVLKLFAQTAREACGSETILARLGGEEFVALMPGRNRLQAKQAGQKVVGAFAQAAASGACGLPVAATVSVGVAELGCDGSNLNELLLAADRALYVAKDLGRNRVELVPSEVRAAA